MSDARDIEDRLRELARALRCEASGDCAESELCDKAACEIDRLRQELFDMHEFAWGDG